MVAIEQFINIVLLCLLLAVAIVIVRSRNLFATVMLFGIFSALTASLFVVLDAVDVAFTEAAVGSCISTILMLGALSACKSRFEKIHHHPKLLPVVVGVVVFATILIIGISGIPEFADHHAASNQHVVPRYIEESGTEIGIPNIVTSILASYRGYDTLGEVVVIFTAGIGVISLLGRRRQKKIKD